jgi:uncharacterized damage-inducible protein DinB
VSDWAAADPAKQPGQAIAHDAMQDLIELFRHNTWANAKVFDLAAGLDSQLVNEAAPGTRDTVLGTLAHLAAVE